MWPPQRRTDIAGRWHGPAITNTAARVSGVVSVQRITGRPLSSITVQPKGLFHRVA